jgi:hypothetical protein
MLLAGVVRQQGPEGFGQLLPQLIAAAGEGPMQVGGAGGAGGRGPGRRRGGRVAAGGHG